MKTSKIIFGTLMLVTLSGIMFTGCRKPEKEDNDTSTTNDNAFAEGTFNDMATIAEQASTGSVSTFRNGNGDDVSLLSNCATITWDTLNNSNVDTLTVDFGNSVPGCLCSDGRYRRGKIIISYTGGQHYRDSGLVATLTPSNYFVNSHQILGTKTVTNRGHITNGQLTWDIVVNGQIIKPNNGGTVSWSTVKTKVLLAGETIYGGPINWAIAKWQITGTISGTDVNGNPFNGNTVTPLVRDMTCGQYRKYFTSGQFDFTPGTRPTREVDFGNGACDNIATVTIGNNTYTVQMN